MTGVVEFNSNNSANQETNQLGLVKTVSSGKNYDIMLTTEQVKQLQKFLPPGFSLVQVKCLKSGPRRIPNGVSPSEEQYVSNAQLSKERRDAFSKAERKIKEPIEFVKRCEYILNLLKKHKNGFPFLEPVDPEVLGIPDYLEIIKEPMDFSKVEKRLKNNFYKNATEFENDIRKIWDNALTYNKPNTQIYHMTIDISEYFQSLINEDDVTFPPVQTTKVPRVPKPIKAVEHDQNDAPYRPSKPAPSHKNVNNKPLTYQEKKVLSNLIRQLPSDSLWEVWKIVSPDNQNQEQEIEFDIDTLSPSICRQLEEFVKSKLQSMSNKKKQVKTNMTFRENQVSYPAPEKVAVQANGSGVIANNSQPAPTKDMSNPILHKEIDNQKEETDSLSFLSDLSGSDD